MQNLGKKLVHLGRCRGATRPTIWHMLRINPTLDSIYQDTSTQLHHTYHIPLKQAQLLYHDLHYPKLQQLVKQDLDQYTVLTIVDENYPSVLKTIKDPPIILYALGDVSLLKQQPALSVIGTRKPTGTAYHKVDYLVQPLVREGWVVVSGMAKGIDCYAHDIALKYGGKTIAILGGGFDHVYPRQNLGLFKEIVKKGLVLSEYAPDIPPKRYHFPERNRIISGLSFGTLVIEATEHSGTLITVDQALDQGREVFSVPDLPMIEEVQGCLKMIQDGATLIRNADELIQNWQLIQDFWGTCDSR